ncbi:Ppx/GppA phosphatase family protein [Futiania mangrovi]|uniref:Ppx/GppA family phosphatase n=1 Tax=Futiania mangrovi TaxID=2959716 RepID=A0A9J6PHR6_9PROT|nr:Ppx/GppA phosphatase family protein [Futiania mangrovii]MCP1335618.1 Ppx/GppA family phosphatase [Futiania mangrovii]
MDRTGATPRDAANGGVAAGEPYGKRKGRGQGRRGRWEHVFAALDLGTNNCRLLVARPEGETFRVIDAFSRIVRLGEGLAATGRLSEAAMDRAVEALAICADKMARQGVTRGRAIATEACRLAGNGPDFADRVRRETGLELDIITNAEEARLAVTGCAALLDRACERALVFDIGGGSTELIWLDLAGRRTPDGREPRFWQPRILDWVSLPCGVVTLSEQFGGIDVSPDGYVSMVGHVSALLEPFRQRCAEMEGGEDRQMHLLGTSGTVTTLAGMHLRLPRYQRHRVDGLWMSDADLARVTGRLVKLPPALRVAEPCIGEDRADLVIAGCAILDALREAWPAPRLRVADRGLREGMLYALMRKADREGGRRRSRRGRSRRRGGKGGGIPPSDA